MSTTFIYALCDPRTLEVRYVGKSNDPYKRYCQHLIEKSITYKCRWVSELLKIGFTPILQILEQCDVSIWEKREIDWIAFERRAGCKLTNTTEGGENPPVGVRKGQSPSIETREKIRQSLLGFKHSEETKKKLSKIKMGHIGYMTGKKQSAETLAKKLIKIKGIKRSPESIEKMRASKIGKKNPHKGQNFTEETKQKIKNSVKRLWKNPQYRKHMSDIHKKDAQNVN